MGIKDKLSHTTEDVTGKVKESVGRATDDRDLQAEGQADQASSNIKKAGENIKDAAKDALGRR
jgi:uncharacterized protein YjbJ (UPF0337 family)